MSSVAPVRRPHAPRPSWGGNPSHHTPPTRGLIHAAVNHLVTRSSRRDATLQTHALGEAVRTSPVEGINDGPGRWSASVVAPTVTTATPGQRLGCPAVEVDIALLEEQGSTVVVRADAEHDHGVLALADTVRDQASDAMAELHRLGVDQVIMLTGDNPRTAASIAKEVGIDEVAAPGLEPQDKADRIRQLIDRFEHVGMVGDGVNDAPPLAAAAVGIAMGTAGSDIALETADIALLADDLSKATESRLVIVNGTRMARR